MFVNPHCGSFSGASLSTFAQNDFAALNIEDAHSAAPDENAFYFSTSLHDTAHPVQMSQGPVDTDLTVDNNIDEWDELIVSLTLHDHAPQYIITEPVRRLPVVHSWPAPKPKRFFRRFWRCIAQRAVAHEKQKRSMTY